MDSNSLFYGLSCWWNPANYGLWTDLKSEQWLPTCMQVKNVATMNCELSLSRLNWTEKLKEHSTNIGLKLWVGLATLYCIMGNLVSIKLGEMTLKIILEIKGWWFLTPTVASAQCVKYSEFKCVEFFQTFTIKKTSPNIPAIQYVTIV